MKLYSTRDPGHEVDLREAVLRGLPPDNGLYMPRDLHRLEPIFLQRMAEYDFPDVAYQVAKAIIGDGLPDAELREIVYDSITFPAPLLKLNREMFILELFHGPSLAFKDFGARFMARLMSYFNRDEAQDLIILVATSGDTGGAVAAGFYRTPGIQVVILYPSGKVSPLQEKQLTTLGENVHALEVEGTFDDCQALVKQAFLDQGLRAQMRLSSANSINIARLIPQTFYYAEAIKQLPPDSHRPTTFCIPSGNFGNLTAGLLGREIGLPIDHFIAATNLNDVVPQYLSGGAFKPKPSVRTLSNAMDVGNPSNFDRMLDLFSEETGKSSTWNNMRQHISGYSFDDSDTRRAMREVYEQYGYIIDPHGAVGYLAAKNHLAHQPRSRVVILETAHPAKFKAEVEQTIGRAVDVPERLQRLADLPKVATHLPADYDPFRHWLQNNLGQ